MRSVFTLLTLPNTGLGFEVLESLDESSKLASAGNILVPAVADEPTGSSASPRKKPRLSNVPIVATRFHASTASRQPLRSAPARTRLAAGPITIQLVSEDDQASSRSDSTDEFWRLLQRTIIGSLERVGQELHLPASFDELYNACRHTVVVAGKGEDLYANQLRLGLQKCSVYIVNTLLAAEQAGVHWISLFVSLCTWFEKTMASKLIP
ncbi:hypothetical protein FISHEDRAFT_76614 [Fistulina hepatica ATCC 64428]|uniref:Uncharacterized protein n=1 Tax=Fistulina hepatica ATCC 64428 TaxID=1128425 RepID=A0A0D7A342_9AGAR|nr:hypothetical protein FISHEDRAFT_76614 [Fistulina hepatica ATCC 64428]